jgi:hypothetical protein
MRTFDTGSALFGIEAPAARTMGSHQSAAAQSTTWLTPPEIILALGPFDLDPCACPLPRPWPTAATQWTRADGSLARAWTGRVWLNPPFGPKDVVTAFMRRMADHNHGTALLFARTETALFFETVWGKASALLFLKGRPHFHRADGKRARANSGAPVVLIAYGVSDAERLRASGLPGAWVAL